MIFISFTSMLGSMFVATMILSSKKLQVHPQTLIAYTCMSEAISSFNGAIWAMRTTQIIEYLDLNTLFSMTFFYSKSSDSKKTAMNVLAYSNDFFFQYFSLITLALNTCLCFDLILTLKNPFQPAKTRMIIYLAASIILCIPLSIFTKASIALGN